jgi:hypothetical protein
MLSDINNLKLYSLMDDLYSAFFGFSETEVSDLLTKRGLECDKAAIRRWYNGYQAGHLESIYNPWSILNCINDHGVLKAYWIKTGDEDLLKDIFLNADEAVREKLDILMRGGVIETIIDDYVSFDQVKAGGDDQILWSLLWALGYLKTTGEPRSLGTRYQYTLTIPNHEVDLSYSDVFQSFVNNLRIADKSKYHAFLNHLVLGNIEAFIKDLEDFLLSAASYYDFSSESNYHIFLLALTATLKDTHDVHSNKEFGLGRPDLVLIPQDLNNPLALIIEIKRAEVGKDQAVYEKLAREAMDQINQRQYDRSLKNIPSVKKILKISLVFHGKQVAYQAALENV